MREPVLFGLPIHLLFLYCMIYSFLGWCMETAYCSLQARQFVARGFLFGPICPIYGVGVLMMICWFAPFMGNPALFYLVATAGMSAWEYFVGWFLELVTHIKYWDYSMFRFNLNGRICLWVCLLWGVLAYLILFWVHPAISGLILMIPRKVRFVLSALLGGVLLFDIITTIQKLALITKLLRGLEELRVQLVLGHAELETMLKEAKEELSEKFAASNSERKAKHAERNRRLQAAYNELLAKGAHQSRRFLNRYRAMSSKRFAFDLADLKGNHFKRRLEWRREERKFGNTEPEQGNKACPSKRSEPASKR